MSRVKGKDTTPEIKVRSIAHRLGYRFRIHRRDLPGAPDMVFPGRRTVVFVHGCFWHGHHCKRGARLPHTNVAYWKAKIDKNVGRDKAERRKLTRMGWKVRVVWECETKDEASLPARLNALLGPPHSPAL